MRRLFVLLFLAACTTDLQVASTAEIICVSSADCPSGRECVVDIGACLELGSSCIDHAGDVFVTVAPGTPCSLADGVAGVCDRGVCIESVCGDGVLDDSTEECDAGAANDDDQPDGCRTSCHRAFCGDGVVDVARGEYCDLGDDNGPGAACSSGCTSRCGDGSVQPGEACDDGDLENGDGCDVNCTVSACGNGVQTIEEGCDDGNLVSGDDCDANCEPTGCGNGIPTAGEECDDGNHDSGDLCSAACKDEVCGNNIVDVAIDEQCDRGPANADTPDAPCRDDCTYPRCGDGILDPIRGERCEPALPVSEPCANYGRYRGAVTCGATCQFDTSGCSEFCGDHVVNGIEVCDVDPPGGQSCIDYGYDVGRLGCSAFCTPGFAACSFFGFTDIGAPYGDDVDAVWMAPDGTVWIASYGISWRDASGWHDAPLPAGVGAVTDMDLAAIFGLGSEIWAAGYDNARHEGLLVHFDGSIWTSATTGTDERLTGVFALATNDVFATARLVAGGGGAIFRYTGTWDRANVAPGPYDYMQAISGTASGVVWAAGAVNLGAGSTQGVVMVRTTGNTWVLAHSHPDTYNAFGGVYAYDDTHVVAMGAGGRYSMLEGASWTDGNLGLSAMITGVYAAAPDFVLAVGDASGVTLLWDGLGWHAIDAGTAQFLLGVHGRSRSDIVIVGYSGTVRHFDGVVPIVDAKPASWTWDVRALFVSSPADAWAGDTNGQLFHFDGTAWDDASRQVVPGHYPVAMHGNGGVLYAVGSVNAGAGFNIIRYSAGTWAAISTGVPELEACGLSGVWTSGDYVFAVGSGSSGPCIGMYDGNAWSHSAGVSPAALTAVFGFAEDDVYVAGRAGSVEHWDGGTWTEMDLPSATVGINAIGGGSGYDLYVVGDLGEIWHSDGETWTRMDSGTRDYLRDVWWAGPNDVLASGDDGVLLHFDGLTWARVRTDTHVQLLRLSGIPSSVVFVGGRAGYFQRFLYGGSFGAH